MKYDWDMSDIVAGRLVESRNRSERYIIGYVYTNDHNSEAKWHLVSLLDGLIAPVEPQTKAAFQSHMNQLEMVPVDIYHNGKKV